MWRIYTCKSSYNSHSTTAVRVNDNKQEVFKNSAPFTDLISKTNNTKIDNAKDIAVIMPTYNLIEYTDNYLKTSGRLRQ